MNYALIGCGRIAVNHIKAALNNKLNIVAVCDVLPEKMEELLAKYGLQNDASIARYTDYKSCWPSIPAYSWPPSPRRAASTPRSPSPASTRG